MRKTLFAMLAMAACSTNSGMGGDDDGSGSGPGSSGGSGGGGGGGDVSAADKQQDYDDVAASIGGSLSAGELASMEDSVNMAYGRMPAGFTITQAPDHQQLDGLRNGLTISYRMYCRDAADAFATCNGGEDHEHVRPIYSGTLTVGSMTIDNIARNAAWIVRAPATQAPRLGGEGTNAFSSHLDSGDYTFAISDTSKNLMFDPSAPTTPSGGTMEITAMIDRTRNSADPAMRNFTVTAHLAVTAADSATLTLDGTQNYTLTISTGEVVHQ